MPQFNNEYLNHNATIDEENFTCILIAKPTPEFPGGLRALSSYIHDKLTQPDFKTCAEGTVYVMFNVNQNGQLSDIKIIRGLSSFCDQEAIRIVSEMPDWEPVRYVGTTQAVRMVLPIRFRHVD
jgi:protein TonB